MIVTYIIAICLEMQDINFDTNNDYLAGKSETDTISNATT